MNNTQMNIEDVINQTGQFISTTSGFSMSPMLRDRRDTIVVKKCSGVLKKYDVPLYKSSGRYVLHRIIKVYPDKYLIRGDNLSSNEIVPHTDVIGKLETVYRNGKELKFNGFTFCLYISFVRIRFVFRRGLRKLKRGINKIKRIF